jgi:hypothetical protein
MIDRLPTASNIVFGQSREPASLVEWYTSEPRHVTNAALRIRVAITNSAPHSPSSARPAEFEAGMEAIQRLEKLGDNWDGYGAISVEVAAQNAGVALAELAKTAPLPDITPNPHGTVSMEWEFGQFLAHLEIGKSRFALFIQSPRAAPIYVDASIQAASWLSIGRTVSNVLGISNDFAETISEFSLLPASV